MFSEIHEHEYLKNRRPDNMAELKRRNDAVAAKSIMKMKKKSQAQGAAGSPSPSAKEDVSEQDKTSKLKDVVILASDPDNA